MFILVGALSTLWLAVIGVYYLMHGIALAIMAIWGTGSDS